MRIVFVATEYISEPNSFDGGMANHFYKLAEGVQRFGHEAIVIVKSTKNEIIFHNEIEVHRVSFQINFLYKLLDFITRFKYQRAIDALFWSYSFRKKVKSLNKSRQIDVVHYSSIYGNGIFVDSSIPSVLIGTSYRKQIDEANGMFNKSIKARQLQILETIAYKRFKFIYTPSFLLAGVLKKELNIDAKVIETPFSIKEIEEDFAIINKVRERIGNSNYILFFGRMGAFKGVTDIADILHPFLQEYKKHYFVFIGKDKGFNGEPTINYILERAGEHKNRVVHFDNVSHSQLFPVIKNAELVVLPSRIENLSNAAIETMSLKKILIGTEGASFDQLIKDGQNGFLCKIANPPSILAAIQKGFALSPTEKSEMEEKALERTKQMHPDIVIKQLIDFYMKAIADFQK